MHRISGNKHDFYQETTNKMSVKWYVFYPLTGSALGSLFSTCFLKEKKDSTTFFSLLILEINENVQRKNLSFRVQIKTNQRKKSNGKFTLSFLHSLSLSGSQFLSFFFRLALSFSRIFCLCMYVCFSLCL